MAKARENSWLKVQDRGCKQPQNSGVSRVGQQESSQPLEVSKELLEVALRALGWGQCGDGAQLGFGDPGGLFQPRGLCELTGSALVGGKSPQDKGW